jgi:hypothetical protein
MLGHTVHVVETPLGSADVALWWSRTGVAPAGREGTPLELALQGRKAELLEVAAGVAAKRRVLPSERGAEPEIEGGAEGVRWWICAQPNGREIAAGIAVTATGAKHIAEAALEPGPSPSVATLRTEDRHPLRRNPRRIRITVQDGERAKPLVSNMLQARPFADFWAAELVTGASSPDEVTTGIRITWRRGGG